MSTLAAELIVALDVPDASAALDLASAVKPVSPWVKVGLELFIAEGAGVVEELAARGHRVMLDLKLHDIPKTVGRAMTRVADLGVELCTVHASGGWDMMAEAAKAAPEVGVLAVTVLTSMDADDLRAIGADGSPASLVAERAALAADSGVAGVVASAMEAAVLRKQLGDDLLIVTPGIRPTGSAVGDQKRIMTPSQARAAGVSMIVVGRPIRDAADRRAAARAIADELAG